MEPTQRLLKKTYVESLLSKKPQINAVFKSTMWKCVGLKTYSGNFLLRTTHLDVYLVRRNKKFFQKNLKHF